MGSSNGQQYDIVLLGATGYTGKLCAEHITTHLPTNLRWAIAGRSQVKLEALLGELRSSKSDRVQPDVKVTTLSAEDLDRLTKTARLVINTIGPYHLYSSPVIEACARNGTHYLDVTGEVRWVWEMIQKYHSMARANGAIIIPEIGIESAPSDMIAWSLADVFRRQLSLNTGEIICTVHEIKGMPSGGTLATVLSLLDTYSFEDIGRATKPWALSPIPGPKSQSKVPLLNQLLGIRSDPFLGTLTTYIAGPINRAIVQRSWGLLDNGKLYGPNFQYNEYLTVRNALMGILIHFGFIFGALALWFRPIRWLVRKLVYAPGEGASKDSTKVEVLEYRAIAKADERTDQPRQAFARFRWDGGHYYFSGVLAAQAAMVILQDGDIVQKTGGGILTPAVLGQEFINRLQGAGAIFETEVLSEQ